jgi:hypothetical protein
MTDERPVYVDGSPGYAVYKAFGDEFPAGFAASVFENWFDMPEDQRERWEEIAERAYTDALVLPKNGYELSIRTAQGRVAFVWVGACGGDMLGAVREAVDRAIAGGAP